MMTSRLIPDGERSLPWLTLAVASAFISSSSLAGAQVALKDARTAAPAPSAPPAARVLTYDVEVSIRYDVLENGVVLQDTDVWGRTPATPLLNGTLKLTADSAGHITGFSTVDPNTGLGLLMGERIYSPDRNTKVEIVDLVWDPPATGRIAPLLGGTVHLRESNLGDLEDLSVVAGFLEDGNSGDFFYMANGIGSDGKIEFTATRPDGVTFEFVGKGLGDASGSGMHAFGLHGGALLYDQGTDHVSVDFMGVTAFNMYVDLATRTLFTVSPQVALEDAHFVWWAPGRRIEALAGQVDPAGAFSGGAQYLGHEFASLAFPTGTGFLADGNSPGFDIGDGLVLGDPISLVLTDATGLFDLVIDGTLVAQEAALGLRQATAAITAFANSVLVPGRMGFHMQVQLLRYRDRETRH